MFKRGHPQKKKKKTTGNVTAFVAPSWMDHIPLQKLLWSDGCGLLGSWAFGTTSACSECTVFPPGFAAAEHSSVVKCQQTSNYKNHVGIEWAGCSRWARTTGPCKVRRVGEKKLNPWCKRGSELWVLTQEGTWAHCPQMMAFLFTLVSQRHQVNIQT